MADREDIIDLAVRYAWALDSKQIEVLREVFLPDATAMLRGVQCDGVDAIIARIGGSILRLDCTQHLISNHQIVVDGDRATHRCQLQSQHVRDGAEGGSVTFSPPACGRGRGRACPLGQPSPMHVRPSPNPSRKREGN